MPLSGAGDKTRVNDFTSNASSAIKLTALQLDNEFDDIDTALDLAFYRDGRATATGDFVMGGNQITGLGDAGADADAVSRSFGDARYLLKAQLGAGFAVNASLANSVGSSELTVALKGADGNDPSASNPVLLPFRSATAGTGTITVRTVTAATSITINSTATLATSNSVAFSLWVVAFDDGGTIRLGVINCLSTLDIYPLQQQGIASSTAEDNGADNAHVFYTGSAVTSKPYIVLGRLIWNSGLATAGTWNAVADVVVNMAPGVKLPGLVVQPVISRDSAVATGTTTIPFDDTIPQNTEGDQYMSKAITPTVAANLLRVSHRGSYASSTSISGMTAALHQDSVANALAVSTGGRDAGAGTIAAVAIEHLMLAATTSATTMKIRAGCASAGTTTFNGSAGARTYGGVYTSTLLIEEIVA